MMLQAGSSAFLLEPYEAMVHQALLAQTKKTAGSIFARGGGTAHQTKPDLHNNLIERLLQLRLPAHKTQNTQRSPQPEFPC